MQAYVEEITMILKVLFYQVVCVTREDVTVNLLVDVLALTRH